MRLTLRTLLAYLDDRLSPANARELGQKISASPFARELAERIKGVVRKRRLASDDSGHKTIDANLIAEYLDDQLTPELVALIEKEILASDHSLAEVAATHQILGLLADPLEVDEKLRKRLYQMDPVAEAEAGGAMTEAEFSASEDWKPLAPATSGSKRSPMLVLLVMVFGWLALMFFDRNLYQQPKQQAMTANDAGQVNGGIQQGEANAAAKNAADNSDAGNGDAAKGVDANLANGLQPKIASANAAADQVKPRASEPMTEADRLIAEAEALNNPLGGNDVLNPNLGAGNPPVEDTASVVGGPDVSGGNLGGPAVSDNGTGSTDMAATDPEGMSAAGMQPVVGQPSVGQPGSENATAANPDVAMTDAGIGAADKSDEAAPSPFSPHTFVVDDPSGALMLSQLKNKDTGAGSDPQLEWLWASNLEGTNNWNNLLSMRVACVAAPFSTTVGCQASGWQIQAVGNSVFQGIDQKYAGLKILHGRYVLTRTATADPEPFLLEVGGRQLLLNSTEDNQRLAITVSPMPTVVDSPSDVNPSLFSQSAAVLVTFAAFGGPTDVQIANSQDVVTIEAGNQMDYRTDGSFTGNVVKQPMMQWEWVTAATSPIPTAQASLQKALLKKLKVHESVREAVAAVAEDSNPMIARWTVQIPTAERDVEQLIRLLFGSEQQVVRSEAFYALQQISRTVPNGNAAIVATMETRLNENEMQQAMRMIEEVSRISLEDRLTSEWLVDMLNSDRLVVREMAISTLEQHLNTRNNYFADDSKSRRDRAIRRWDSELDRNDGRLIPPQE